MNIKLLSKLSSFVIIAASLVFTVPAAAYTLQDDPSSTWSGDSLTTRTINGNVVTYQNLFAQNLTSNSLPALSFAIPFIWPNIDTTYVPMEWRNDLNGWYTSNFNNTGTSLTVSLTSPVASAVFMGELADLTGSQQLPLTEPCQAGSPSCTPAPYPPETRNLTDLIPIISLGAFAPDETKRFDLSFTYSFGDQRVEALPTAFIGNTVSPVPEPETYAMFVAGLGLLGSMLRRRRTTHPL
ncbi:PEP-CTERM sorting domain-containing protein [Nitrosospira briensis]|uniref:PEP-CTERM sorting domain-containing protein n=1 Tax=Nitrosospira briensis TaxID=35799 RepID=UPI0008F37E0F|nr:PEP-CTERM sorting domain-containing protein [Nitrosospira briensis]SFO00209.1 PEP-CTERM protein-sorting domain-containing protein [Nitrosospira briensis]